MEVLSQVQSIIAEHAFTLGIGLLVATVIAAIAWYWMSRGSKNTILENQARINTVEIDIPEAAAAAEPQMEQEQEQGDNVESQG